MISVGMHRGLDVLWFIDNGKRREVRKGTDLYESLLKDYLQRQKIVNELRVLMGDWKMYFDEPFRKAKSRFVVVANNSSDMNYESWAQLKDCECPEEKKAIYMVNGRCLRSRAEMQTATAAEELRLTYKYDCGIRINRDDGYYSMYLDFAFAFEEFNRWVAYELFGMLNDRKYVINTTNKIQVYMNSGMYLERDLFVQSSDNNFLENIGTVKSHLIWMVDKLCDYYVHEV